MAERVATRELAASGAARPYLEAFERRRERLEAGALAELRRRALGELARGGFPNVAKEQWKFTSAAAIARSSWLPADGGPGVSEEAASREIDGRAGEGAWVAAFAGGKAAFALWRRPPQAQVVSLAEANAAVLPEIERYLGRALDVGVHGFAALNTALFEDGAAIVVPEGEVLERPLHLLYFAPQAGRASLPRTLIVSKAGSQATVALHFVGCHSGAYLTDGACEVFLEEGARLTLVAAIDEGDAAFHVHRTEARLARGAWLGAHSLCVGGGLVRSELHAELGGPEASCELWGLALASGRRHVDYFSSIDHRASHTESRQLYKGVCGGRARSVFAGKVLVGEGTEKVSAEQTNKNLLLSPGAAVETEPQLEIYADDVRCSHGATVGQLDEDVLFYLRQRGIDRAEARVLCTRAFAADVLERLPDGLFARPLQERIERVLADCGAGREGAEGDKR